MQAFFIFIDYTSFKSIAHDMQCMAPALYLKYDFF